MTINYCFERKVFHSIFLLFLLVSCFQAAHAQKRKPNVVFILGDDIGYETLNVNGGKSFSTPNLDTMAQKGMNFTECHTAPLCSPSRFMLLTGKYNFRNYTRWGSLDTSAKTIGNLFEDAGYKTACFGKWQLNGGDISIHKFGFESYCVTNPQLGSVNEKYKSPHIYTNGAFAADSLTDQKYGDDIFTDSIINFIERNQASPFFVYYPMALAHRPFQPTPDDSGYAKWHSDTLSDTIYYPSMIKYMDKKIGEIVSKIKELGLDNNTIIIYSGDNGTPSEIFQSTGSDSLTDGGKGFTTEAGTHVPLIVDWPGKTQPGSVDTNLIEFTDFLPTLAGMIGTTLNANYGIVDGVNFTAQLKGLKGKPRDWLFYHYDPNPGLDTMRRWAQTAEYKLYDTSAYNSERLFYNIKIDPDEQHPISHESLSGNEINIKKELLNVMTDYIHQGFAILGTSDIVYVDDSSALLADSVKINGGSTIKVNGAVWGTDPNPSVPSSQHTRDGKQTGPFQTQLKRLTANKTYYVRAYATNVAGTSYSNEIKFKTLLHAPVALPASALSNTNFTAHWLPVSAATAYKLDVSKSPVFAISKPTIITRGFGTGATPPPGWTFIKNIDANDSVYGNVSPSVQFKASGSEIISEKLNGPAAKLKFWIKGINTDNMSSFLIEAFDGTNWKTLKQIVPISQAGSTKTFIFSPDDTAKNNLVQFRFTYTKSKGTLVFDDVVINYNKTVPFFVDGYNGLKISDTISMVSGLQADSDYYYRVRATSNYNTSNNSNTIKVTMCSSQNCRSAVTSKNNIQTSSGNQQLKVIVFPNPSSHAFLLTAESKSNEQVKIFVTDAYGRKVYETLGKNARHIVFGNDFSSGIYFVYVTQGKDHQALQLVKEK